MPGKVEFKDIGLGKIIDPPKGHYGSPANRTAYLLEMLASSRKAMTCSSPNQCYDHHHKTPSQCDLLATIPSHVVRRSTRRPICRQQWQTPSTSYYRTS